MVNKRKVIVYKNYFTDFYSKQNIKVQEKVEWTLKLFQSNNHIPEKYFKHLTNSDGLYEIRIEVEGNIFRVFSFFDRGNIVVLGNGFQKKTQKTPQSEIKKANKIKMEYFNEKE